MLMLTVVESARLLLQIFPNYPDLGDQRGIPPRDSWPMQSNDLRTEETTEGIRHYAAGEPITQTDFETLQRALQTRQPK